MNADDALIAEKLFGWTTTFDGWLCPETGWHGKPPAYTSNAADDYAVLGFVRSNWDCHKQFQFQRALCKEWHMIPTMDVQVMWTVGVLCDNFTPGAFSRAAIAVLKGGE